MFETDLLVAEVIQREMFMSGYSFCNTSTNNRHYCKLIVFLCLSSISLLLFHTLADASHGENQLADVNDTQLDLDLKEKNWLNSHPVIRVAGPKAFPPFHFYDADGHAQGMARDYLDLIMTQLRIRIEQQSDWPWPDVLKKARDREIDAINSVAKSTEREDYLLFSDPILSFPIVIITRKNAPFVGKIDDLGGMKVAFVKDNIVYDWIHRDGIAVEPHFVGTPLDALSAVSSGIVDAHIENLAAAAYLIEKYGLVNLKIAAPTPYQNYTLHIAIRKDWPEMVSIVNKSIRALSSEQHTTIRNKWLTVRYEFGIRMADIWMWAAIIAVPVLAAITGILFWNRRLQREITDRKRAEEALRNSEERLRMIAENTGSFIAVLNHSGIYEFVNPSHRKLGLPPESLIGTSGLEVIHPDDRNRLASFFQPGIPKDSSTRTVEYRVVGMDGIQYFIEGTFDFIRSRDGEIEKIVFVGDDITERKQVQESLTREREMLAMVISGMRAGIWEWDVQSGNAVFDERWAEIAGFSLEEIQPINFQTWIGLCHPEDWKHSEELLQAHFDGKEPYYECECRMHHKSGSWVWVLDRGIVVKRSKTGEPITMVGTHVDITRRKEAEAQQAAMEIQNQQIQKAESLSRMAGAIAHLFNNQLHVVMGSLELAKDDLSRGKSIDHNLSHALLSAQKASDVSTLMLTYLGQTVGKPEVLDLAEVCHQSLPMLQAAVPPDVLLESDIPPSGPVIMANPSLIQQILNHLLTNAWEATILEKKEIHLTLETVFPEAIPVKHRFPIDWKPADSLYACLSVSDTGSGIAEKDIEKLFDPFFTTKFTGRGLGLPIIIGIVRAYNGVITVESEFEHGSVFKVFFPMSDQMVSSHIDSLHESCSLNTAGTVMLVEDDEMVREMVSEMFSHLGVSAILAKDGIDAITLFRKHEDEIRCVLTDMTMPRMNGWELISTLKSMQPDIPIILTSGYDKSLVMDDSHPDPPKVFLHKPYTMNELKDALIQALQ